MKTVTIQIGNSDDKLSQYDWANFVLSTHDNVNCFSRQMHFTGFSSPHAVWQNAAWVFEIDEEDIPVFQQSLARIASQYNQESIAWTEGETEFIKPI